MKGYPYNFLNIELKDDVSAGQRDTILTEVFGLAGIMLVKIAAPPVTQENAPGGLLVAEIEPAYDTGAAMDAIAQVEGVAKVDIRPLPGATAKPKSSVPAP